MGKDYKGPQSPIEGKSSHVVNPLKKVDPAKIKAGYAEALRAFGITVPKSPL